MSQPLVPAQLQLAIDRTHGIPDVTPECAVEVEPASPCADLQSSTSAVVAVLETVKKRFEKVTGWAPLDRLAWAKAADKLISASLIGKSA